MNKNIMLTAAVVFASGALIFIFSTDEEVIQPKYSNQTIQETLPADDNTKEAEIKYVSKPKNISEKIVIAKKEKPKREKYLEYDCIDGKGKFIIALINPNQDLNVKAKKYIDVTGRIDGSTFNLKVPDYLVSGDNSAVSLRIKNRETGLTTSVPAYFLNDLRQEDQRHFVNIDSNDIENYEYKTKKRVLPLPGNDTINE